MKFIIQKIYLIGTLFAFSPLLISLIAIPLSYLLNCETVIDHIESCNFLGTDYSGIINLLFFFHWLTLWTLPLGILIILAGFVIRAKIKKREERKK